MSIRVRFAPSPTGALHIGGMRTALFNYLFAKKNKGKIILRIEDTDNSRLIKNSQKYIENSLKWVGIDFDESPEIGGKYGPYIQSKRKDIYDSFLNTLIKNDKVYLSFDSIEEINSLKEKYKSNGEVFSYNYKTRKKLFNSLTLSKEKVEEMINQNIPYVVRFKIPEINKKIILNDLIYGTFTIEIHNIDDKILIKSDGTPTYHFANVIDDYLMKISHVIRGEEWLSSLAFHVLLYDAFKWNPPIFAHLPLILEPEGNKKLSKRYMKNNKYLVLPLSWKDDKKKKLYNGYKEEGYLPEAFLNILFLLGFTPLNNKEILSIKEMISQFEIKKIHNKGAHLNPEKNKWINKEHLLKKSNKELLILYKEYLDSINRKISYKDIKIIKTLKERIYFIKDIYHQGYFFYEEPKKNNKYYIKFWKSHTKKLLIEFFEFINFIVWNSSYIKIAFIEFTKKKSIKIKEIIIPIRLKLVGKLEGPDISIVMEILGKKECLYRIFS